MTYPPPLSPFWAWLAGFTDGEGYVEWHGTAQLVLTTTHRATLEWIQVRAGGALRTLKRPKPRARQTGVVSKKPTYQLSWTGENARTILAAIQDHLQEKRRQVELVLSVSHAGGRVSEADWRYRDSVRRNLKNLRHGRPEVWPASDPAGSGGVAGSGIP